MIMVLIAMADPVMYFIRPFPQWICILQLILRGAVLFALVLLINAIVIARYILIFWMKNPLSFQDDFWCIFVNLWIIVCRSLSLRYFTL